MAIAMVKILGGGGGGGRIVSHGNITFGSGRGGGGGGIVSHGNITFGSGRGGGGGGGGCNRFPLTMAVVVCMTDDGG